MEDVAIWLGIIATALGIVVSLGGFGARALRRFEERILERVDRRLDEVDRRFDEVDRRFDEAATDAAQRFDRVDERFEALEARLTARIDGVERVTDVRLSALETDVRLIKQHLLGSPSAA